eukprot:CAMPEP_0202892446 /NCGR_PEP_ID=MMETSP1392-20130828/2172_1 /ASSEMBLY_ACC=CAM_ASM_000868 /TAXON_ID=225041 /ORGANISM="Chlamydomonas chlamydogama, Strain SAG 11-48b" /LENGTH=412 /DNA_ID=CAMNT_0049576399 /DNA_START=232 /DNA_END=1470 /DNA_ORIENTATION=-
MPRDSDSQLADEKGAHHKHPLQQFCKQAQGFTVAVAQKLGPFGAQMLMSSLAYSTGLGFVQVLGYGLRISCRTPVLSSCFGALGVSLASILAGHTSRMTKQQLDAGRGPLHVMVAPFCNPLDRHEAMIDAVAGVSIFKLWKGQFNRVLPSDLRKPGAFAYQSVPIGTSAHATDVQKGQLISIFKRDGCHHCGNKRGAVIGDHIPPTKMVLEARAAAASPKSEAEVQQLISKVKGLLQIKEPSLKQRYYAQCTECSSMQAEVMRHGRRLPMVLHKWIAPPGVLPGLIVGFRDVTLGVSDPGRGKSGGGGNNADWGSSSSSASGKKSGGQQKPGGLWGWATRMEEVPGQDVFRSFDTQVLPASFEDRGIIKFGLNDAPVAHVVYTPSKCSETTIPFTEDHGRNFYPSHSCHMPT